MVRHLLLACMVGALLATGGAVAGSLLAAPSADADPVVVATTAAPALGSVLPAGSPSPTAAVAAARDAVAALPEPEPMSEASTSTDRSECIGFGCSDEQDALLAVQEAEAQDEYWATAQPEPTYQSSGDAQRDWGCQQRYITEGC